MRFSQGAPRRFRIIAWVLMIIVTGAFLGFTTATIQNYTEIVVAKLVPEVTQEASEEVFTPDGAYEEVSQFRVWANFTVSNPSTRPLRMWVIEIKAWVRDYEVEDGGGLDRAFRDDRLRLETESGLQERYYFPVFVGSKSYISKFTLADAASNTSFSTLWQFTSSILKRATETLASIYRYATTERGIQADQIEWYYFAKLTMFVEGVRRDFTGPNDSYLIQLPLVVRRINFDLGQ